MSNHPQVPEIKPIAEAPKAPELKLPPAEVEFELSEKQKLDTKSENFLGEAIEGLRNKLKTQKKKPSKIPQVKDETTVQIEKIMEEDLVDAFRELTPIQKQRFKIKGEETAWKTRKLLKTTRVKIKKIFRLILEWLKMLPGINRFFLEQEAKIKTDKIIALKEQNK